MSTRAMERATGSRSGRLQLTLNLSSCKYDLLRDVASQLSYEVDETGELNWDLHWVDSSVSSERVQKLLPYQRLNHFPGMLEGICRKAALTRNMQRMAVRLPALYDFYPTSLVLPEQLDEFGALLRRNKAKVENHASPATYILKPSGGTMGRGIRLVQTLAQLHAIDVSKDSVVAQAYVADPLLLDGLKFDLRVYALVLSVDPLKIYLYEGGLARLATVAYQAPSGDNLHLTNLHLTNYAVNKDSANFVQSNDFNKGTKRLLSAVLSQLSSQHGVSVESLRTSIASVVVKTILAIQPSLAHTYHTSISSASAVNSSSPTASGTGGRRGSDQGSPHGVTGSGNTSTCTSLDHGAAAGIACNCPPSRCFEVLGFDIMFDAALKPWLLEVNHSPSFCTDEPIDYQVKMGLLTKTIAALGQDVSDRQAYLAEEAIKQTQRLYQPHRGYVRRPITGSPKSQQLAAAAAALDELTATSTSLLTNNSGISGGSGREQDRPGSASLKAHLSGGWRQQQKAAAMPQPSQLGERSYSPAPGDGFERVYPVAGCDVAEEYSRALEVATDLFQDQRCQCLWCCRRREARLLQWAAWELANGARRPSSATEYQRIARTGSDAGIGGSATDASSPAGSINLSSSHARHTGDGGSTHAARALCSYSNGPGYGNSHIGSAHVLPRSSSARRPPRPPSSPSRSNSTRSREAACSSSAGVGPTQHRCTPAVEESSDGSRSSCGSAYTMSCSSGPTSEDAWSSGKCTGGGMAQQQHRRISQEDKTVARYLRILKAAGLSSASSWRSGNSAPDISLSPGQIVLANFATAQPVHASTSPSHTHLPVSLAHTLRPSAAAALASSPAEKVISSSSSSTVQDACGRPVKSPYASGWYTDRRVEPLAGALTPRQHGQAWLASDAISAAALSSAPSLLTRTVSGPCTSMGRNGDAHSNVQGASAGYGGVQRAGASSASRYKGPSAVLRSPTAMAVRRAGSAPRLRPESGSMIGSTSSSTAGGDAWGSSTGESGLLTHRPSLQDRGSFNATQEGLVGLDRVGGLQRDAVTGAFTSHMVVANQEYPQGLTPGRSGNGFAVAIVSQVKLSGASILYSSGAARSYTTSGSGAGRGAGFPKGPSVRQ